jgi:hypothetical protein
MNGITVLVILAVIGLLGFSLWRSKKNTEALERSGKIIKRANDFYDCRHVITTKIATLQEIYDAMNKATIREMGISTQSMQGKSAISFKRYDFTAILEHNSNANGVHTYTFYVSTYKEQRYGFVGIDQVNALLTSIERAVASLDYQAEIVTQSMKRKTKTSFL